MGFIELHQNGRRTLVDVDGIDCIQEKIVTTKVKVKEKDEDDFIMYRDREIVREIKTMIRFGGGSDPWEAFDEPYEDVVRLVKNDYETRGYAF